MPACEEAAEAPHESYVASKLSTSLARVTAMGVVVTVTIMAVCVVF